ncbi:hypothetical protein ACR78G_00715 [Sphingobacterium spiritivorum]|uniref:hypothetical protein n=1 Tax=Sphingobacterium spiritivorum TaxID=258 RepID=UPI003DA4FE04
MNKHFVLYAIYYTLSFALILVTVSCKKDSNISEKEALPLNTAKATYPPEEINVSCRNTERKIMYGLDDQGCVSVWQTSYWYVANFKCPGNSYLINLKNKETIKLYHEKLFCKQNNSYPVVQRGVYDPYESDPTLVLNVFGVNSIPSLESELSVFNQYSSTNFTVYILLSDGANRMNGTCFFGFESNGKSRTVGFYPANIPIYTYQSVPSVYFDNSEMLYVLKVKFTLPKLILNGVLNTLYNNGIPPQFSIDSYNSAHLTKQIFEQLDIYLPNTISSPYELAAYIRQSGLPSMMISPDIDLSLGTAPVRN